jgi:hypothetical protein
VGEVDELRAVGFWSYVRDDDDAEGGRIRRLAQAIQNEYTVLTGESLRIFIDRDDISWGEEWRRRIAEALAGTTFFIPVVTPRYFKSEECRRELLTFAMHAQSLGVSELLLPLLYVDVPGLADDNEDEAVALVARTQYERWTALRLADEQSPEYRQGINTLAMRLMEISEAVTESSAVVRKAETALASDEPGLIDILADAEAALPRWSEAMERFGPLMEQIAGLSVEATTRMERSDAAGKGFAGRIVAIKALASALDPLTSELLELGTTYASELVTVDSGVLTIIRQAEGEVEEASRAEVCEFFESIRGAASASREMAGSLAEVIETLRAGAGLSRDLRPPLKKMEDGLRRVMDGQSVMDEWVRLMDESNIDCADMP